MTVKLLKSLFSTDSYMLIFVILTGVSWAMCYIKANQIQQYVADWTENRNISFSRYMHTELGIWYSLFTAMISIFPLLGMFGTVRGLLNMDFAAGNMDFIRQNFFGALTSTAWGIIFSVFFKIVYAVIHNQIETQIENSQAMAQEVGELPHGKAGQSDEKK